MCVVCVFVGWLVISLIALLVVRLLGCVFVSSFVRLVNAFVYIVARLYVALLFECVSVACVSVVRLRLVG